MLLTEEEAREKWCPQVRRSYGFFFSVGSHNLDGTEGWVCIGSGCCMWRFAKTYDECSNARVHAKQNGQVLGYCGLAGRPE